MLSTGHLVHLCSSRLSPKSSLMCKTLHQLALSSPLPPKPKPNKSITPPQRMACSSLMPHWLSSACLCACSVFCQECPVGGGCGSIFWNVSHMVSHMLKNLQWFPISFRIKSRILILPYKGEIESWQETDGCHTQIQRVPTNGALYKGVSGV